MQEKTHPSSQSSNAAATACADALIERIGQEGSVSIATFMETAATAYYAGQRVFGRDGDFITAPEVSQLFGEMIAAWLMDIWLQAGQPPRVDLIELGPGRGTLSADILRTLGNWPAFLSAIQLHLVETSHALRQQQSQALVGHAPQWHDTLADVPVKEGAFTLIVANEFLDALPIHQFEKTADGRWMERHVAVNDGRFVPVLQAMPAGVVIPPDIDQAATAGGIFEVSPVSLSVIEDITRRITHGGAALLVDYGHTTPGIGDTLQALEKHAYVSPLENPGGRDITAHVDFGTCAITAEKQGGQVHGPVTQSDFLQGLGITARVQQLATSPRLSEEDRRELQAGLVRLISPGQMGRLFKVMAITAAQPHITPAGFAAQPKGQQNG